MIHSLADVQSVNIGNGTNIWQFSIVLPGAVIGNNCNIACHTFIENEVIIGNNVTVKSGIYIWDGVTIEDDVFLGPAVVFTNDIRPRSKQRNPYAKTVIKKGASLGANSTVLAGITVGRYALTGIGSVITKSVPDHALIYGNPARQVGWVDERGVKLITFDKHTWISVNGTKYKQDLSGLVRL